MSFSRLLAVVAAACLPLLPLRADAANAPQSEPPITVAIVLFDGVQIIDFSAPYEVFGQAGFGVLTVSADGRPVTTAMGLRVTPDHAFADAPAADVLLVPGGEVDAASQDPHILAFVRDRAGSARQVLSVCTGARILAAAGLLEGKRATTFHRALDSLARDFPEVDVVRDVRWADNGRIITSAGLSSGIDAALHLVARMRGEDVARSTALHLEYDWQPEGGFVRTALADRFLPDLDDVPWPADAQFHRLLSLGDERQWRVRYHTTTELPAEQLLALIDAAMAERPGWSPLRGGAPHGWSSVDRGHRIELHFLGDDADADPANGYEFEARLSLR